MPHPEGQRGIVAHFARSLALLLTLGGSASAAGAQQELYVLGRFNKIRLEVRVTVRPKPGRAAVAHGLDGQCLAR